MLKNISRMRVAAVWCVAVLAVGAASVVAGATVTMGTAGLLLAACLVPPIIMMLVWRGAPPVTVAELLHTVNGPSKDTRP